MHRFVESDLFSGLLQLLLSLHFGGLETNGSIGPIAGSIGPIA